MPDLTAPPPSKSLGQVPPAPAADRPAEPVTGKAIQGEQASPAGAADPADPASRDGQASLADEAGHADPADLANRRPRRRRAPSRDPLPDAVAILPIRIPEAAPPYDDALTRQTAASRASQALQPVTHASQEMPPAVHVSPPRAADESSPPASARQIPGAGAWPSQFAQVLAETLAGSRPSDQIAPWTTEQARRRISQLGPILATAHRPRVRRVIVTSPTGGVLEMAVIVGLGGHVRALAVRLEQARPARPGPTRLRRPITPPGTAVIGMPEPQEGRAGETRRWYCTAIEAA